MIGVLAMSLPGGVCFLWAGLGLEHHHHGSEVAPAAEICVHDHDHGCADHDHDPAAPEQPCDPDGLGVETLALVAVLKIDPAALPAQADFSPDWVTSPEDFLAGGNVTSERFVNQRVDAPPPPVAVRLCRFLI